MGSFHLSKWYLDCVTDDGSAFIGYWARLRWGALTLEYAAALLAPVGESPRQVHTLRSPAAPARTGTTCTWQCAPLQLEGHWDAEAQPVRLDLLESPAGGIRWTLHQPRAQARLRFRGPGGFGAGRDEIAGTGYVEELELTIPPWQLPFDVLYWGRFLSAEHDLVWIRWERGAEPEQSRRRFVLLDGVLADDGTVSQEGVHLPGCGGELRLGTSRPLREGALAANVFRAVPGLTSLLPRRFQEAYESKRLSRSELRLGEGAASEGWSIHEVVKW